MTQAAEPRITFPTDVTTVRSGALSRLVAGLVDAFRPSVVPGAAGPRPGTDQMANHVGNPSRVWPIRTSDYGAPNSQQRQVITNLPEYARFHRPLSGEVFVADPAIYTRVVRRRMGAPPIVAALVPSANARYRAPMYVGVPADQAMIKTPVTPAHTIFGGR